MMKIKLSNGEHALIDAEDWPVVSQYTWHAGRYVRASGGAILLHRLVTGFPQGRVDHRNRNTFDNQKQNLRRATQSQNLANSVRRGSNTSGYKGVYWNKAARKWHAQITFHYVKKSLGYFPTARQAARAYAKAAKQYFGEFARI